MAGIAYDGLGVGATKGIGDPRNWSVSFLPGAGVYFGGQETLTVPLLRWH